MSIPLWIFLYLWIGIVSLVCFAGFFAALMCIRFGLAGTRTVLLTLLFVTVPVAMLFATAGYASSVDWDQTLDILKQERAL